MTRLRPFTTVAAVIFAIMAIGHLYRLITHFQIVVGSETIPEWASIVALVVLTILSFGLFREARGAPSKSLL